MPAPISKIPVRLQLGVASNPPAYPFDLNTGVAPRIFRGSSVSIDLGVFDDAGTCLDLSNVDFLEVDILPLPITNQDPATNYTFGPFTYWPFPSVPPAPLLFDTIGKVGITGLVSNRNWLNGTQQQARAVFDWIATQSLDLGGQLKRDFWLVVHGLVAGQRVVYGATRLSVYESGAQGLYLPNWIAPLIVPAGTILYVEPNQQLLFSATIDIVGVVEIEGILIQV